MSKQKALEANPSESATPRRASSVPVLNNTTPGRRMVLAAQFPSLVLPAEAEDVELRIVLNRPDGNLADTVVASDGSQR